MALVSVTALFRSFGFGPSSSRTTNGVPLPIYSPVASTDHPISQSDSDDEDDAAHAVTDEIENGQLHPAQRHAGKATLSSTTSPSSPSIALPSLARFLADFTLGFADGLTVPFALTAGLSSLGQTDTVIYAGMAEICAGSISMGIGGYLSAKGENAAAAKEKSKDEQEVEQDDTMRTADLEKTTTVSGKVYDAEPPEAAAKYLEPLDLPPQLMELVSAHLHDRLDILRNISTTLSCATPEEDLLPSPLLVGLSVSLGYLLGGLLPLFPYFIVGKVGDGLLWSFIICVIALFAFGFTKDFVLARSSENWLGRTPAGRVPWREIRHSAWEGAQMVILGSTAAVAAVVCVRAFEGMGR